MDEKKTTLGRLASNIKVAPLIRKPVETGMAEMPVQVPVHEQLPVKGVSDPDITLELIEKHGITSEEYDQIKSILMREPNFTELGIFSVMWSEHCSYKNSKPELRKFPTTGKRVLVKAGEENAGVIDIGDNMAVAFKIESHNHPSAVEPFQGAATGVGGILRDIFTMGARPVANMNSLRFGPIQGNKEQQKTNRRLLAGVTGGIAHYGNCIGVPTVGGEASFDTSYNGNPLVNAFCLGILRHDQIRRGAASGVGNPVFYVGAKTGRDGLAGAAFASRDLTEESKEDRPAVQVGDPFMEKLLMEACLELFEHPDAVVGVQDMGAAGLTCSTCETASRGDAGIEIDLARVPQREKGMTPYEIMLSESQERMLIIIKKGHEQTVEKIFDKWDLDASEIGVVTDSGRCVIKNHGQIVANIPAKPLADDAPVYHRKASEPMDFKVRQELDIDAIHQPVDMHNAVLTVLGSSSIASKRWIYRQYDHMVQTNTVTLPGSDASVIRVPVESQNNEKPQAKYLAMSLDCNGRYCSLDPREGAKAAFVESARNIAMSGGEPLAITDNLNYGNPHVPEVFWQLREGVEGLSEGCKAFGIPVTGGNVSLYNQSPIGAIDPTPVVGMVGLIEDEAHITTSEFKRKGDVILLVGGWGDEIGGSAYLEECHNLKQGMPPRVDFTKEKKFQDAVKSALKKGLVHSAHDISDGGLAVALAESCINGNKGCGIGTEIKVKQKGRLDVILFNETQGRAILSTSKKNEKELLKHFERAGIEVETIGKVVADQHLWLQRKNTDHHLRWTLQELSHCYEQSIPKVMDS
ncbi:MAG: phosphoribosylformylglycinamidine synthase subunit PurL [Verrucomicrobiota bacterium]